MREKFRSAVASAGYHVPYCVYPNIVEHIAKVYNLLPNAKSEGTDSPLRRFERNVGLAETIVTVDELQVGVLDIVTINDNRQNLPKGNNPHRANILVTSIEFGNGANISGIPLDTSTTK